MSDMEYCDEHKEIKRNTDHLMQWKDGNGAKGAEKRLQEVERDYLRKDELDPEVKKIVRITVHEILNDRTTDWNKWINTLLLVITTIGVFVGFWGGG